jgi:hypothetical protein
MRRHVGVKEAIQRVGVVCWCPVGACVMLSPRLQHWELLTSMKPEEAKYVTKDEYIAYFLVAYGVLMPDEEVETSAKLVAIEVGVASFVGVARTGIDGLYDSSAGGLGK